LWRSLWRRRIEISPPYQPLVLLFLLQGEGDLLLLRLEEDISSLEKKETFLLLDISCGK
jgi:hypothetical protein